MQRMRRNRKITTALVETRIRFDRDGGFRALVSQQIDGRPVDNWPKDERPADKKPVELRTSFTVGE